MKLAPEILGLLVTALPAFLSLLPLLRPPSKIGSWVGSVLLTAAMSILSMGFLMMRLTARCVSRETPCPTGSNPQVLSANIFEQFPECGSCVPAEGLPLAAKAALAVNGSQESFAIASAAICTLVSVAVLARFAAWVRRQGAGR
jgi:hypothetical protein